MHSSLFLVFIASHVLSAHADPTIYTSTHTSFGNVIDFAASQTEVLKVYTKLGDASWVAQSEWTTVVAAIDLPTTEFLSTSTTVAGTVTEEVVYDVWIYTSLTSTVSTWTEPILKSPWPSVLIWTICTTYSDEFFAFTMIGQAFKTATSAPYITTAPRASSIYNYFIGSPDFHSFSTSYTPSLEVIAGSDLTYTWTASSLGDVGSIYWSGDSAVSCASTPSLTGGMLAACSLPKTSSLKGGATSTTTSTVSTSYITSARSVVFYEDVVILEAANTESPDWHPIQSSLSTTTAKAPTAVMTSILNPTTTFTTSGSLQSIGYNFVYEVATDYPSFTALSRISTISTDSGTTWVGTPTVMTTFSMVSLLTISTLDSGTFVEVVEDIATIEATVGGTATTWSKVGIQTTTFTESTTPVSV